MLFLSLSKEMKKKMLAAKMVSELCLCTLNNIKSCISPCISSCLDSLKDRGEKNPTDF